jgi:quercetin dioxygenase-like cupin family protein
MRAYYRRSAVEAPLVLGRRFPELAEARSLTMTTRKELRMSIKVHLRSEQSGGAVSVVETTPPPGAGPPLHHHDFDEAFYVLEGRLTFRLRDEYLNTVRGDLVFAPRGVPHTFANLADQPARQLIVCTPAGFERYFARIAAERDGTEPPGWATQPIPEVVRVGPPIDPEGHLRRR